MSPGAEAVMTDSGTRESEHPSHITCIFQDQKDKIKVILDLTFGSWLRAEVAKKLGSDLSTFADQRAFDSSRFWLASDLLVA
jgi:hypothetical protein